MKKTTGVLIALGVAVLLIAQIAIVGKPVCEPLALAPPTAIPPSRFDRGLLFEVVRDDAPRSYIFGTMHVDDPEVVTLPPVVGDSFKASRHYVMEVVLDDASVAKLSALSFFAGQRFLSDLLDPRLLQRTLKLLHGYGLPEESANRMTPWAAYITLSMPPGRTGVPLDLALMREAHTQNKAIHGLETIEEQTGVFTAMPETDQVDLLKNAVCHYQRYQSDLNEWKSLYLQRDLHGLLTLPKRYKAEDPGRQERFMNALLDQRNVRMTERMLPLLAEGRAFIALGALHLAGDAGVLALLEQHGYLVIRRY